MASCIEALINGFPAASGGTVEFYQAGTTTPSVLVFTDPEGTIAASDPHTLDGDGSIERYVEERVRIVVKDDVGATLKEWTHGQDAKTINVESLAYTGALSGGGTGPGGATTLQNALALQLASFGAEDDYVSVGGVDMLLQAALASTAGTFFNVVGGYGAAGDGVADDTAELQAAINAATNAGGGIIFIPTGTYPVSAALTMTSDGGLQFMGVHAPTTGLASKLLINTNGLTGGLVLSTSHTVVRGITFAASTSAISSPCVAIGAGVTNVRFEDCTFIGGAAACVAGLAGSTGLHAASFANCHFKLQGTSGSFTSGGPSATNGTGGIFNSCTFDWGSAVPSAAAFDNNHHIFNNCNFLLNGTSGGVNVFPNSAGTYTLVGCKVVSSNTSGTNNFFQNGICTFSQGHITIAAGTFALASSSSVTLRESGSVIPDAVTMIVGFTNGTSHSQTWQARGTAVDLSGLGIVVYTPNPEYAIHEVTNNQTTHGFGNPSPTAVIPPGQLLIIRYINAHASLGVTPTFGASYKTTAIVSVPAGYAATYQFAMGRSGAINGDLEMISQSQVAV